MKGRSGCGVKGRSGRGVQRREVGVGSKGRVGVW